VLAAPASGAGKTSITTGLLAALRARGLAVSPHKVGPDYIDPGYHALAAGRQGRNLDPWLVGEHRVAPLFLHGARTPRPADVAVIEGVMGLFDGHATRPGFGSTAHVARLLAAPVVLVVDARSAGRSVAATVHGFRSFDREVRIGGVVFNQVGTERHAEILRAAMAEIAMPVLGLLGRRDSLATPSRHLGLVPVAERAASAQAVVAELAEAVATAVDLDALLALAASAPDLPVGPWEPASAVTEPLAAPGTPAAAGIEAPAAAVTGSRVPAVTGSRAAAVPAAPGAGAAGGPPGLGGRRPVVAVAGGPAFTFGYAETVELLTAAGADVARFDPTADDSLPAGTSALVIGGGFPEMHAGALAANVALRGQVRALAAAGAPIAAECAGLLYLSRALDGEPMCGVLGEVTAVMTPRLTLGYREATAAADSVLAARGAVVRGHEFHRTATTPAAGETVTSPAWHWRSPRGDEVREGFVRDGIHASYLHIHWAGVPGAAARFVAAARETRPIGAVRAAG